MKIKTDSLEIKRLLDSHPWYKNISINGARWRVFRDALNEINQDNSSFIIYQPPVSKSWKKITKNTFIHDSEMEYSNKLEELTNKYSNIEFYDYYTNDINELSNKMYYDYQHLNQMGAKIFSENISNKIIDQINTEK